MTQEERDQVVADHRPLAWNVANRAGAGLPEADIEDIAGDLLLSFVKLVRKWEPERGASFTTYALTFAWGRAAAVVRRIRRRGLHGVPKGKKPWVCELYIGDPGDSPGHFAVAYEEPEPVDVPDDFWQRVRWLLPKRDFAMVHERYVLGRNMSQIGAAHGITRQRVQQMLARSEKKLRDSGLFKKEWL